MKTDSDSINVPKLMAEIELSSFLSNEKTKGQMNWTEVKGKKVPDYRNMAVKSQAVFDIPVSLPKPEYFLQFFRATDASYVPSDKGRYPIKKDLSKLHMDGKYSNSTLQYHYP